MYAWLYLYHNYFPLGFNVRRTSSKLFAPLDLSAGGYRNQQGGQDSNIDEGDDDMSRLQETDATYADRGEEESDRERPAQERDYYQEDYERYYEERERERDREPQYADRYGWDQYA
jgi:hypothetical protein